MALYATKQEALEAAEAEKRKAIADAQKIALEQLGGEQRRLRHAIAGHVVHGLIAAWGETRPDINRLVVTTIKITDTLLDALEKTEDGNYEIPQWNASGW